MQQLSSGNRPAPAGAAAADLVDLGLAVARLVRAQLRRRTTPGMTLPQLRALGFVNADPDCAPSELAEYLMLSRPAVTRLLNGLVRRRLIVRRAHTADRRRLELSLTPRGKAHLEAYFEEARSIVAGRLAGLSPQDRSTVRRAVRLALPLIATTTASDPGTTHA